MARAEFGVLMYNFGMEKRHLREHLVKLEYGQFKTYLSNWLKQGR